jgi:hypothetical protein
VIAAEANAKVEPEHPALKQLFGVTSQDLYDISQQGRRQGNMAPDLWQPSRAGKPNEAALAVMNPANAQRLIDTLAEARKYPGLEQGMVPWYVMDPAYQQMERLVGPERAAKEFDRAGEGVEVGEVMIDSAAREAPQLLAAVLHEEQSRGDPQYAQQIGSPLSQG